MTTPLKHAVIRASAGSGKTFALSNRYIALLAAGSPPEQILAATFARKAAGEILDRVLVRLARAGESDKSASELSGFIGRTVNRKQCSELLSQLVQRLPRLRIGTMDSYFSQLARTQSWELGLSPNWTIGEESDIRELRRQAVRDVLTGNSSSDLRTLLDLLQRGDATRGISDRLLGDFTELYGLYLESNELNWRSIARPTRLGDAELSAAIAAFEAYGIPPKKSLLKGLTDDRERLAKRDWLDFLKTGIAAKVGADKKEYASTKIPDDLFAVYQPLVRHAKDELLHHLANQTEASFQLLHRFDTAFRARKRDAGLFEFGDVPRWLQQAAAQPADDIRTDGPVQHLLLDEFQDTSLQQWSVLEPLAKQITASPAAETSSFFCVGDVKQAIYGWRGGVAAIFDQLTSELTHLDHEPLSKSYRSSPAIIDAVNRVFGGIDANPHCEEMPAVATAWHSRFDRHETARTALPGHVQIVSCEWAEHRQQPKLALQRAASLVAELHRERPAAGIGVLVRTNRTVARLIDRLRTKHGVEASEESGNPLGISPAVQIVLAALRFADHPGDSIARFHAAASPIGELIGLSPFGDAAAAGVVAEKLRRRVLDDGYAATIRPWVLRLAAEGDPTETERCFQLLEAAYKYDERPTLRTDDFAAWVSPRRVESVTPARVRVMNIHQSKGLEFDIVVLAELEHPLVSSFPPKAVEFRPGPLEPIESVVRHISKDLHPFLPDSITRAYRQHAEREFEQSLCLLYVAMTRAKQALHLVIPPDNPDAGKKRNSSNRRSRFSDVLRSALLGESPLAPNEIVTIEGDANWSLDAAALSGGTVSRQTGSPATIRLRRDAAEPPRRLNVIFPSMLKADAESTNEREGDFEPSAIGDADAESSSGISPRSLGVLYHAWLAGLNWLESPGFRPSLTTLRSRTPPELHSALDAEGPRFLEWLGCPAAQQLLVEDEYRCSVTDLIPGIAMKGDLSLRVLTEVPLTVVVKGELVRGRVDRLVLWQRNGAVVAADLIDWKTDAAGSPEEVAMPDRQARPPLPALARMYGPQLRAYRTAIATNWRLDPACVAARLVAIRARAVIPIDERGA